MTQTVTKHKTVQEALKGRALGRPLTRQYAPTLEFNENALTEEFRPYIIGTYQGSETGVSRATGETFLSHRFVLESWEEIKLSRQQGREEIDPEAGMIVGVTGKVLDESLKGVSVGTAMVVEFVGYGQKKPGQNPAKLFAITPIE